MKILVVDQYYYPEEFQINEICEQMVKDGHYVTVLTGLPNYPTGIIPEDYKRGKKRDEFINGVHVLRSFEIGRKKNVVGMTVNYLSYAISASIKQFFLDNDFDVVFIYETSPVILAVPGEIYAKRLEKPVFFYCCDIWPECAKVMINNENSIIYKFIKKWSTQIYQKADLIALQSKGFFKYFEEIHHIPQNRLRYLPQFADSNYLEIDSIREDNGIIDFVFLGNVGIAQDIGGIINAVELLKDTLDFKVHIVGDGSYLEEAKRQVYKKHLEKFVIFYGRRPHNEMQEFYKLADVCLATLQADSLINLTLPSKVQEYMAAGKPILAALAGKSRDIIEQNNCGLCVMPGDVIDLSEKMREYIIHYEKYINYGINGREYFKKNFTKDIFMKLLYRQIDESITLFRGKRV